jgi:hypothetical protein
MSTAHDTAAGAVMNKAASAATYGGSGAAVYFGMSANEIAAFGGLLIAAVGLLINWWYKHQHLKLARTKLEEEESQ